jgi:hypothetical protein
LRWIEYEPDWLGRQQEKSAFLKIFAVDIVPMWLLRCGMNIEAYLAKHNWTRAKFASEIQATEQTVGRYINGVRTPTPEMMRRIHAITKGRVTRRDFVDEFGAPLAKGKVA